MINKISKFLSEVLNMEYEKIGVGFKHSKGVYVIMDSDKAYKYWLFQIEKKNEKQPDFNVVRYKVENIQ